MLVVVVVVVVVMPAGGEDEAWEAADPQLAWQLSLLLVGKQRMRRIRLVERVYQMALAAAVAAAAAKEPAIFARRWT